jgi:hypothetical protein
MADVASGKLGKLVAQAEADIAANRVRDLDEVLYWIWIGNHDEYEFLLD